MERHTLLGIVEGFYGRLYTEEKRHDLLKNAALAGYDFYIYSPKNDPLLRMKWETDINEEYRNFLFRYGEDCRNNHLECGIAISPVGLTSCYKEKKEIFLNKFSELIKACRAEIAAIFFDDVKLDSQTMGQVQNHIIRDVSSLLPEYVKELWICPTYYSFDPILEKLFGKMPENYFKELTCGIDSKVRFFWTGDKVLSKNYTQDSILKACSSLGRDIIIWDNYPVNDGKKLCEHLYVEPFQGRRNLEVYAHAVNPMVQAYPSILPLITLPIIYKNRGVSYRVLKKAAKKKALTLFGEGAESQQLIKALFYLNKHSLSDMAPQKKQQLCILCNKNSSPAALEFAEYLQGKFAFDSACLTS